MVRFDLITDFKMWFMVLGTALFVVVVNGEKCTTWSQSVLPSDNCAGLTGWVSEADEQL